MPAKSWLGPLLSGLAMTGALLAGLIYFVVELWPRLPAGLALVGFIVLAVLVIGYPIWALARWSNRYLEDQKRRK